MRTLLTAAVVVAIAGPATACINDVEVESHEREFRSQYRDVAPATSAEPAPATSRTPFAYGGGALLLVGAVVVSARKPAGRG